MAGVARGGRAEQEGPEGPGREAVKIFGKLGEGVPDGLLKVDDPARAQPAGPAVRSVPAQAE